MNTDVKTSGQGFPAAEDARRKRTLWLWIIWVAIAGVIVPVGLGFINIIAHMGGTFAEIGETGRGDAQSMEQDTAELMIATAWLWAFAVVAFVGLIGALIRFRNLPNQDAALKK